MLALIDNSVYFTLYNFTVNNARITHILLPEKLEKMSKTLTLRDIIIIIIIIVVTLET